MSFTLTEMHARDNRWAMLVWYSYRVIVLFWFMGCRGSSSSSEQPVSKQLRGPITITNLTKLPALTSCYYVLNTQNPPKFSTPDEARTYGCFLSEYTFVEGKKSVVIAREQGGKFPKCLHEGVSVEQEGIGLLRLVAISCDTLHECISSDTIDDLSHDLICTLKQSAKKESVVLNIQKFAVKK